MSTILDALRKVEEEKRTHEADVRTRLLASSSSRFDFRTRRRSRMPWVIGGGLILSGVLLGAGMVMLRTSGPSPAEVAVVPSATMISALPATNVSPQPPVGALQPPPSVPPQPQTANPLPVPVADSARQTVETAKPPPQAQVTPNAPAIALPKASRANIPAVPVPQPSVIENNGSVATETSSTYSPWHGGDPQATSVDSNAGRRGNSPSPSADVVQRSPFVNTAPYDRIVVPPTPPPPSASRVTAKAPQRAPALDEKRSKPSPALARRNEPTQSATPARSPSAPENTGEPPPGTSLTFLQWSADPEKRVASIKVGTGPATLAHEGDSIDGITIEKIRPDAVELRSGESRYLLKAR